MRKLVDQAKVFALVATSSLDYAGAPYVSHKGVPDIGGIPIGTEYDTYPHLYGIYGSRAPRDGTPGWGGTLYAGTEVYRFFKERLKARTAAVVYYNQSASARYADQILRGLKAEGYRTISEEVDFALPNFRAVAADLRARHVDILFDAMDTHGNGRPCRAMQSAACHRHRQGHQRPELGLHRSRRLQGRRGLPQRALGDLGEPQLRRHLRRGRTRLPHRDGGAQARVPRPVATGGVGGRHVAVRRDPRMRDAGHKPVTRMRGTLRDRQAV